MSLIITTFKTPISWLEVGHDERHVHHAKFVISDVHGQANTPFCAVIANELNHYFQHSHHRFQLPIKPQGTRYQFQVWEALLLIPAGSTLTYGELSKRLNSCPRAIGQACKKNPITLFIPCHRVVGKQNYGGYMGSDEALLYKVNLLNHEG